MSEQAGTVGRWRVWNGVLAFLCIVMSVHLHWLYGRLHWPGANAEETRIAILDILHLDSFLVALLAIALSIACTIKGSRILGIIALALAIGALMNSFICY